MAKVYLLNDPISSEYVGVFSSFSALLKGVYDYLNQYSRPWVIKNFWVQKAGKWGTFDYVRGNYSDCVGFEVWELDELR